MCKRSNRLGDLTHNIFVKSNNRTTTVVVVHFSWGRMKEEQKRVVGTTHRAKACNKNNKATSSLADFVNGSDENNLAEFPLALLADSPPPNQKTLEFQDTIKDWKTGQEITRRVCVTGSDKFGLPTAKDDQVLTALIQLTGIANNYSSPEVFFTKHQVIELLGWDNSGWAYQRVEESLHRWKGVSVHYWNAWRDHENQTWTDTEAIGVIDYFKLADGRRAQGPSKRSAQSRFVWNRELFKSFQAGYMKPLDFGLYRSLKRPAARRAYRFLDKRFHHRPDWEFDLHTFACEKLGFSRKYDTGQLKARLHPAMTELEQAGFIEPISYRKTRPKTWSVLVMKRTVENRKVSDKGVVSPLSIVQQLTARGITMHTAKELAAKSSLETIEEKLKYVDWLISRKNKQAPTNTAGFLVAAIRNNYSLPKEFRKTHDANGKGKLVAPPNSHLEPPLDNAVEQFLLSLSEPERQKLEIDAVNAADPRTADGYHRSREAGGPTFTAYRNMVIERYVRRVLIPKAAADEDEGHSLHASSGELLEPSPSGGSRLFGLARVGAEGDG